jgi:MFS family permease
MSGKISHIVIPKNIWLIWISTAIGGLAFLQPIYILYLQQELNDIFLISLILAVGSIFVILFELPSGAIADIFGRKRSLLVASGFSIGGLFLLWIGGSFWVIGGSVLLSAIAQSLISGTIEAIIFDSLNLKGKNNKSDENPDVKLISVKKAIAINIALWPIAASLGALIGGFTSEYNYRLPIFLTLIAMIFNLVILFFILEPPYQKPESKNILHQIFKSFQSIWKNSQLLLLFLSGFLAYAFAEIVFQFKGLYLEFISFQISYLGIVSTISFIFSFLGSFCSEKVVFRFNEKYVLIICQIGIGILILFATLIKNPYIAAFLLSIESFFWGMRMPVQVDWMNSFIKSEERATINSVGNLANHLGFSIFLPIFGVLLNHLNFIWLFRIMGSLQIITIVFLFGLKKKKNREI